MQYTESEKAMLEQVNEMGMQLHALPDESLIFAVLAPYLEQLMDLLKRLEPSEMQMLFMRHEGIMKIMRMIENSAQKMEKELN